MRPASKGSFLFFAVVLAVASGIAAAQTPAVPLNAIAGILDAFSTHDVVALGEGRHNNEQGYAFRLALLRDPRFPAIVNDIVVESGSSKHQEVMDRFIRGEAVPDKTLRLAWQDTTVPDGPWDVPMYEEFFRAVRDVNASLPADRRLRVLLGDPPFDWEKASREEALRISLQRDRFPAELIRREVLAKGRRALVIYGDAHLLRRPPLGGSNLVTLLTASNARVFTISTHTSGGDLQTLEPDVSKWPAPSLVLMKGTTLGLAPFTFYRPGGTDDSRMEDQYDAVLYVGPVSSVTIRRGEIDPALCADDEYLQMRFGRMTLMEPPGGAVLPPGIISPDARLRRYCVSVAGK